jgi:hypothetical protein
MRVSRFILTILGLIAASLAGCQGPIDPALVAGAAGNAGVPPQVKPAPASSLESIPCTENPPELRLLVTIGKVDADGQGRRFQNILIEGQGFLPGEIVHFMINGSGATHSFQLDTPRYTLKKDGSFFDRESLQLDEPNMAGQVVIVHQRGVACVSFGMH